MQKIAIWFLLIFMTGMLASFSTPVYAQSDCPPGMYWSRETVACEQTECPPDAGRTYTLECQCPQGSTGVYEQKIDPATGKSYSLMAACSNPNPQTDLQVVPQADPGADPQPEAQPTGLRGWWGRQTTRTKAVIVVGGAAVLLGGALAAGLITWAGVTALAGSAVASISAVTPYAAEVVTAWASRKAMKAFVQRLARQSGKYLVKRMGRQVSQVEVKQLMLNLINQELVKRGIGQWSMAQFDTLIAGIDLFW